MPGPDDSTRALLLWLAALDPVDTLVIACPDEPLPRVSRDSVVVSGDRCLFDIGIGLPAQLLASGLTSVAVLPCARAREDVQTWRDILPEVVPFTAPPRGRRPKDVLTLGQIGVPRRVILGMPIHTPLDLSLDESARTLRAFQLLQDSGRAELPPPAQPQPRPSADVNPGADAPHTSPPDVPAGPASTAAELSVSGCIACGVCVRACPHEALHLEHIGDTSTLSHDRESCRSEHRCIDLCPVDAIAATGAVPIGDVLGEPVRILAKITTAPCERCGARYRAGDDTLCAACRFRAENVFGSALPPGVAEKLAASLRRRSP